MGDEKQDILEVSPEELAERLRSMGQPAYRLRQILAWLYTERVDSFDAMSDLPLELRRSLEAAYTLFRPREVERLRSHDGETEKLLFELADGEQIESVWMKDAGRSTFCISSQAGCGLACRFCSTGAMGFGRNLRPSEIVAQVLALASATTWPANIVFMGMGEPLLNLEAVLLALETLTDARRMGLSPRRIAISTAGITPGIRKLMGGPVLPRLALSLNSPFDEQRSELMPINRKYPLADVLDACREYSARSNRQMVFEYVLLGDVNSSDAAARALAQLAQRLEAIVNVILFNTAEASPFHPPTATEVRRFKAVLKREGVRVTERFRRGRDIAAACGQLRGKHPA